MQAWPAFGKSILLGASFCSLLGGCAVTGPAVGDRLTSSSSVSSDSVTSDLIAADPMGAQWEDPCSPDWPAACMPGEFAAVPRPLLDCLARWPHREETPEAPSYPRFHPLPTRPMFSPAPPPERPLSAAAGTSHEPIELGTLP